MSKVYINKIETAVPEFDIHQKFIDYASQIFPDEKTSRIFQRMIERSHISHRWSVLDNIVDYYTGGPNNKDFYQRMLTFEKEAPKLAIAAVQKLNLDVEASEITHLIVISSTGFYTPGLDSDIVEACGLGLEVSRINMTFMGCHSGVSGLKQAFHIVGSDPNAKVLVVSVELSTLFLQRTSKMDETLTALLFSDGAGAAIFSAQPTGMQVDAVHATLIPDTRDLMYLKTGEFGLDMFLSGKVPTNLSRSLKDEVLVKKFLHGESLDSIEYWAIHPGGRTILDAAGNSLELTEEQLFPSRSVLEHFGNMASATIFFVLQQILDAKPTAQIEGRLGCCLAYGPGVTQESFIFRI